MKDSVIASYPLYSSGGVGLYMNNSHGLCHSHARLR